MKIFEDHIVVLRLLHGKIDSNWPFAFGEIYTWTRKSALIGMYTPANGLSKPLFPWDNPSEWSVVTEIDTTGETLSKTLL